MTRLASVLLLGAMACLADPLRPVTDAAPDTYTPAALDQQRIGGLLSDSMRANVEGYLERVDPERELSPFSSHTTTSATPRVAESAGWFLRAAATAYEYGGNPHLKSLMDRVATQLVALQKPDGYLGINPDGRSWKADELPALASNLNGLLAYAHSSGDETSITASRRIADLLTRTLYADSVRHTLLGLPDWRSAPGSVSLMHPLTDLYRATDDARYLQLAKSLSSRLASVASDPESKIVYASALVDLYRLSGDANQLKTAVASWKDIHDHHLSITGAPEAGTPAGVKPVEPALASTCALAEWTQLNLDLLRVTGNIEYADQLEQSTYNQLLASQDRRTGEIDSYVQMGGSKNFSYNLGPCHAAASYTVARLPEFIWGRYGEGIALMGYVPGRVAIALRRRATVQIYTETDYPASGDILLHIEPSHEVRFPLRLRVPEWAKDFEAQIGRTQYTGKPGQFLVIDRTWKKSSTVRISFDLPVRTLKSEGGSNSVAFQRGPQILALSKDLNAEVSDLSSIGVPGQIFSLKTVEAKETMLSGSDNQIYSLSSRAGGETRSLILAPVSDVSNFRIWLRHEGPS